MSTSPLILHAAPGSGFDQPFEMLLECHQRVERMLVLLEKLAAHLATHGSDARAGEAARDVMRYFDVAGPAHHEDEERHLFPALQARGGAAAAALATRLHQEHEEMARMWAVVRANLAAVQAGAVLNAAQTPAWAAFAELYRGHIAREEGQAYPQAAPLFDAGALAAMGDDMARRRGAR
jgi:hemerythrin-like domain-containing protein